MNDTFVNLKHLLEIFHTKGGQREETDCYRYPLME